MGSIQAGPHYEVQSTELAKWLEEQASHSWWNVDGDPLLTGRVPFPCPTDELAAELRKIDRPLLIQAPQSELEANGQSIDSGKIGALVSYLKDNLHTTVTLPEWADDRFFYLSWKSLPNEWMLTEDSVTAKQFFEVAPETK